MATAASPDTDPHELKLITTTSLEAEQRRRVFAALGLRDDRLPPVSEELLARYHKYLSENLSFPFRARYPEPTTAAEEAEFECTVLELLDPSKHIGDDFDGIFCKTRKGKYEVNLPLVELEVSQDDPNFQMIEDYWYWFWNSRYR
jgi:hypothetical protein